MGACSSTPKNNNVKHAWPPSKDANNGNNINGKDGHNGNTNNTSLGSPNGTTIAS
jgi:hypothetical protein